MATSIQAKEWQPHVQKRLLVDGARRQERLVVSSMAASGTNSRSRYEQSTAYGDFFAGFGFGSATGSFATLDENVPVCGGFGLPRILMLLLAIAYLLLRNHSTPEISREFDNEQWLRILPRNFRPNRPQQ
jgi:hypothetical protein